MASRSRKTLKLQAALSDIDELDKFIVARLNTLSLQYINELKSIWECNFIEDCIDFHNLPYASLSPKNRVFKRIVACIFETIDDKSVPSESEMTDARSNDSMGRIHMKRWLLHNFDQKPAILRRNEVAVEHILSAKRLIGIREKVIRDKDGFPLQQTHQDGHQTKIGYDWKSMDRNNIRFYANACYNVNERFTRVEEEVSEVYFGNKSLIKFGKWKLVRLKARAKKREAVVPDYPPKLVLQWAVFMKVKGFFVPPPLSILLVFPEPLKDRHVVYIAPTFDRHRYGKDINVPTGEARRLILSTFDVLLYPGYFAFGWGESARFMSDNVAINYGGFGRKERDMDYLLQTRTVKAAWLDTTADEFFLANRTDVRLSCRCKCGECKKPAQPNIQRARCNTCHSGRCPSLKRKKTFEQNKMMRANVHGIRNKKVCSMNNNNIKRMEGVEDSCYRDKFSNDGSSQL